MLVTLKGNQIVLEVTNLYAQYDFISHVSLFKYYSVVLTNAAFQKVSFSRTVFQKYFVIR